MTEIQTIWTERRTGGNNKQKQNAEKAYLDTKVECWALCFCLPPLAPSRVTKDRNDNKQ